jgi:hypothetical protein
LKVRGILLPLKGKKFSGTYHAGTGQIVKEGTFQIPPGIKNATLTVNAQGVIKGTSPASCSVTMTIQ